MCDQRVARKSRQQLTQTDVPSPGQIRSSSTCWHRQIQMTMQLHVQLSRSQETSWCAVQAHRPPCDRVLLPASKHISDFSETHFGSTDVSDILKIIIVFAPICWSCLEDSNVRVYWSTRSELEQSTRKLKTE